MPITPEEVRRIADLARLELTDEEVERFSHDLERILDYVDQLKELDGESIPAETLFPPAPQKLREDMPKRYFTQDEALAGAPDAQDGLFRVPRVISGDNPEV